MRLTCREMAALFDLSAAPDLGPRYNVAPTQPVAIVRGGDAGRELAVARWGLIPHWSKDAGLAAKLINARSETVAEKAAFRDAFRRRRCLIPADGFYEWAAVPGEKHKRPHHFRMRDGRPFTFAGLGERWHGEGGPEPLETCAILTTGANAVVQPVHERMPVILLPADYAAWLDPSTPPGQLHALLRPYPAEEMTAVPVGPYVSNPRNEGPHCLTS
jgi:putative SOS response-associated peptidase YedK